MKLFMSCFDAASEVKGEYLVPLQRCASKLYVENFTSRSWLIKLLLHRLGPALNECVLQGLSVLVSRK